MAVCRATSCELTLLHGIISLEMKIKSKFKTNFGRIGKRKCKSFVFPSTGTEQINSGWHGASLWQKLVQMLSAIVMLSASNNITCHTNHFFAKKKKRRYGRLLRMFPVIQSSGEMQQASCYRYSDNNSDHERLRMYGRGSGNSVTWLPRSVRRHLFHKTVSFSRDAISCLSSNRSPPASVQTLMRMRRSLFKLQPFPWTFVVESLKKVKCEKCPSTGTYCKNVRGSSISNQYGRDASVLLSCSF